MSYENSVLFPFRVRILFCLCALALPLEIVLAQGVIIEAVKFGQYTPHPTYPPDARDKGEEGSGIAALSIDPTTGRVSNAAIALSTGSKRLDEAALFTFRQWRFKPGMVTKVNVPFGFWLGQIGGKVSVKARPMDDVLAPFVGKGNVIKAPIPQYPPFPPWTSKKGRGVYELHVNEAGHVTDVKILKSSGDATFDAVTVQTLRQWKLRNGPKVIELPLAFVLTPESFRVRIQ